MTILQNRYELREKLGEGGMAEVYRAIQLNLDREVAIKFIKPNLSDPMFATRFEREAKAVARLNHPNIVHVHDFDQAEDGRYFMSMELLSGSDLASQIKARRLHGERFSLQEAIKITQEIAQALRYAHQHEIIHRDIKPHNIFLTEDQRVVVTDFGIAKILSGGAMTESGAVVGTPHYFAPEQGGGGIIDHRVDLYALGILFYELLTGQVPFDADSTLGILAKHASAPIPDPREKRPDLPIAVTTIIERTLAKDPADRYADAGSLFNALELLKQETPPNIAVRTSIAPTLTESDDDDQPTMLTPAPKAASRNPYSRSTVGLAVMGVAMLLAAVAAIFLFSQQDKASDDMPTGASDITPAADDEYLIVVANVKGDEEAGLDVSRRIETVLRTGELAAAFGDLWHVEQTEQVITSRQEAETLAETTNALIIVWGVQDAAGLEIVLQSPRYPEDTIHELSFLIPPGDDFSSVLATDMPIIVTLYANVLATHQGLVDNRLLIAYESGLADLFEQNTVNINEMGTVPTSALDRYVLEAFIYLNNSEFANADTAITNAINLAPEDPVLYFMRWTLNGFFLNRNERAMQDAQHLTTLLPESDAGLTAIAMTAFFAGDYDTVIANTEQLPGDQDVREVLAVYRYLALLGDADFETTFAEAKKLAEEPGDSAFNMGDSFLAFMYELLGDQEAAEERYGIIRQNRALEGTFQMFPMLSEPPANLITLAGYIAEVNENKPIAVLSYQTGLADFPDHYLLNWRRGLLYESSGDYQRAYDSYQRAAENAPVAFPVASYELALLVMEHGSELDNPMEPCQPLWQARREAEENPALYQVLLEKIISAQQTVGCD